MQGRATIAVTLAVRAIGLSLLVQGGCARKTYDPAWATRAYPHDLHTTAVADMQVFRRGTSIEIVNSTPHSYSDFDLWINQRYVRHVESLPAGSTLELSLWEFHDDFGDVFYAGGFFRSYEATPVRLVEIQPRQQGGERGGGDRKMIGLVSIRVEDIIVKPEPGRAR